MPFQLVLNKTFCLTPASFIHRRFKYYQRKYINKAMPSAPPSLVFHTRFTISVLESKYKYSILTVIELGSPVSESSAGPKIFMLPLILKTNFIKRGNRKLATNRIQSRTHNSNTMFNH